MKFFFHLFLPLFTTLFLYADHEEERLTRRIQAHLTLQDYVSGSHEAEQALQLYPQSTTIHESFIRALSKSGEEKKIVDAWNEYIRQFPDKSMNRELIEEMAWGILYKASRSSSIIMRQMSLLAAFFSQDAKGVTLLKQGIDDSNYAVRAVAVKLAGHYRDDKLIDAIKRLFKEEKVWAVRQKVLEAIGSMKIVCLQGDLEALIASNESLAAEKALAISSLLELLETINRAEVERLSSSSRSGLRHLACKAIAYFQSHQYFDQLAIMTKDPQFEVRLEAFQAIGQIHPPQEEEVITLARQGIKDPNYQVAISAAWLLTIYQPDEGKEIFLRFLSDQRRDVRYLSAAALNATGRYGISLVVDQFHAHADPYVRLNLAVGLIGQRQAIQEAADLISQMLMNEKEKWSYSEIGLFKAIVNKPAKKTNDPLTTPEIDNQLIRLELLNLLAILKIPNIQQSIRHYLMGRAWEISAVAASLLLTECDEAAVELVQELLKDEQSRIRLQAALILSLWSKEESAIQVLEEGYLQSDWDLKAKILEGLGRIGSVRSIPFLINVLKENSQTLRLIAAMSIIQCLNH